METVTRDTSRTTDRLSLRLHEQARRHRARAIAALFARLIERLSALRFSQMPVARWG